MPSPTPTPAATTTPTAVHSHHFLYTGVFFCGTGAVAVSDASPLVDVAGAVVVVLGVVAGVGSAFVAGGDVVGVVVAAGSCAFGDTVGGAIVPCGGCCRARSAAAMVSCSALM